MPDEGLSRLFSKIKPTITLETEFCSDMNPSYRPILEYHFPTAKYIQHKSRGGCVTAQGELKKVEFDPKKAHQGRAVFIAIPSHTITLRIE